jgi:hypothetical protein
VARSDERGKEIAGRRAAQGQTNSVSIASG